MVVHNEKATVDWDQFLNPKEVVDFTRAIIQAPSENPPGDTRDVAMVVESKCLEIGLQTRIVGKDDIHANVVAIWEGSAPGPTLLFNGHIDTVPAGARTDWDYDPFGGEIDQGRMYGRGAADMLGGVAAMIMATQLVRDAGRDISGKVVITAVADEETGGALGTGYLLEQGLTADAAIVTEPSELDLHLAHKGAYWIRITTKGVAAHGSVPEQGVNAVEKMAKVITNIGRLRFSHPPHPLLSAPTISVGTLEGGTKTNVVPSQCSATFDIRTVPGQRREQIRHEIQEFLNDLSREDSQIKAEIEDLLWIDPAEIDKNERIVKIAADAIELITGRVPEIKGTPGASDARLLASSGIPTIPFLGPGSVDQAHKRNEYVDIDELIAMTKVYAEIICNFLPSSR